MELSKKPSETCRRKRQEETKIEDEFYIIKPQKLKRCIKKLTERLYKKLGYNYRFMKKLNIGCGNVIKEGYVNLDFYNPTADILHNLNKFPYPFSDNTFDEVYASHILEHLDDTIKVMEEIHRITKPNGRVIIKVPHYSSFTALSHLTHKRAFGLNTFSNFEAASKEKYSDVVFKVIKRRLNYYAEDLNLKTFFSRALEWFINKHPNFTEGYLVYYIGGIDEIYFELEVIK